MPVPLPVLISASNMGKWVTGELGIDQPKDKFIFDTLFSVSAASKNMCHKISDNCNESVMGRL